MNVQKMIEERTKEFKSLDIYLHSESKYQLNDTEFKKLEKLQRLIEEELKILKGLR